jgi:hypothetical protein
MPENTNAEQSKASFIPLAIWYVGMIFCTVGLCALGIISKDNSVNSYVVLGAIAMCYPPVENMVKTARRNIELRKEYEERKRKAEEEKLMRMEMEKQAQEKGKIMAASELAKRQAAKAA